MKEEIKKKQICILGSTGSIGTQALDVIEQHSDLYEVYCLTANNSVQKLAEQAHKFKPAAVVIANEEHYEELQQLLVDEPDIKVYAGRQALEEIVQAEPIDMVLASMVGFSGLVPTINAIKAGKKINIAIIKPTAYPAKPKPSNLKFFFASFVLILWKKRNIA